MLVAKQKRKENIAEYILYIYEVVDLIRAFRLDMDLITKNLIESYNVDESTKIEISDWYKNLVVMMEKEGKQKTGHLQFIDNLVKDLNEFHLKLLQTEQDKIYKANFLGIVPLIEELKQKNTLAENDIQIAFDAIYGYLLLKIQNKTITEETKEAVKQLGQWLGHISKLYKDYESGDLEI